MINSTELDMSAVNNCCYTPYIVYNLFYKIKYKKINSFKFDHNDFFKLFRNVTAQKLCVFYRLILILS